MTINDWLGTTLVLEKELWILIWFLTLQEPFLSASANACDTDKSAASLSLWSPSFKWLIAPSTIVFIQIICSWKRFNLLELISYSCWNTSKCSKRELSKLSPHGACWEGSCHLSPWRAALRFFSLRNLCFLFQSQTLFLKDALFRQPISDDSGSWYNHHW